MREKSDPRKPSACRSCGAQVLWATTTLGKQTPLDAEPVPDGDWILAFSAKLFRLSVTKWRPGEDPARRRYTNHFSTCASADQHRSPKASSR